MLTAVLLAVGCGNDEDTADGGGAASLKAGSVLNVSAEEYSFSPAAVVLDGPGELRIRLENDGSLAHNIKLRRDGDDVGGTASLPAGDTGSASVQVEPGRYELDLHGGRPRGARNDRRTSGEGVAPATEKTTMPRRRPATASTCEGFARRPSVIRRRRAAVGAFYLCGRAACAASRSGAGCPWPRAHVHLVHQQPQELEPAPAVGQRIAAAGHARPEAARVEHLEHERAALLHGPDADRVSGDADPCWIALVTASLMASLTW